MKYRKKPVEVEAEHFTEENKNRAFNFITCTCHPDWDNEGNPIIKLQTLNGPVVVPLGEWIVKGVAGEFYPCRDDIFQATYEAI